MKRKSQRLNTKNERNVDESSQLLNLTNIELKFKKRPRRHSKIVSNIFVFESERKDSLEKLPSESNATFLEYQKLKDDIPHSFKFQKRKNSSISNTNLPTILTNNFAFTQDNKRPSFFNVENGAIVGDSILSCPTLLDASPNKVRELKNCPGPKNDTEHPITYLGCDAITNDNHHSESLEKLVANEGSPVLKRLTSYTCSSGSKADDDDPKVPPTSSIVASPHFPALDISNHSTSPKVTTLTDHIRQMSHRKVTQWLKTTYNQDGRPQCSEPAYQAVPTSPNQDPVNGVNETPSLEEGERIGDQNGLDLNLESVPKASAHEIPKKKTVPKRRRPPTKRSSLLTDDFEEKLQTLEKLPVFEKEYIEILTKNMLKRMIDNLVKINKTFSVRTPIDITDMECLMDRICVPNPYDPDYVALINKYLEPTKATNLINFLKKY